MFKVEGAVKNLRLHGVELNIRNPCESPRGDGSSDILMRHEIFNLWRK